MLPDFLNHRQLQEQPFQRNCGAPQPTEEEERQYQIIIEEYVSKHSNNGNNGNGGNANGNANGINNNSAQTNSAPVNRGLRSSQVCTTFPVVIPVHFHVIREEGSGNGDLVPQGEK